MKGPIEIVLAILCVASLYWPFSVETSILEMIGYLSIALLSASLIIVLHLRPNDALELPPFGKSLDVRPSTKPVLTKK